MGDNPRRGRAHGVNSSPTLMDVAVATKVAPQGDVVCGGERESVKCRIAVGCNDGGMK